MKKLFKLLLVLMVIITATACSRDNNQNNEQNKPNNGQTEQNNQEDKPIEEQVKNETEQKQNDILLRDIKISEYGASNLVTGKVKNLRTQTRNVQLTLKMYNSKTNRLLGRVTLEVKNLTANEERDFEMSIMGDYTTVDKFEVEANDL